MGKNGALGQHIRESRIRLGLSQEKLAELVGTHRRHVIRWEQGLHRPSGVYAERLAEVLKDRDGFEQVAEDDEEAEIVSELHASLRRIVKAEMKRERKRLRELA
jgi:transcriptional regulator with XRE-family HTH domain